MVTTRSGKDTNTLNATTPARVGRPRDASSKCRAASFLAPRAPPAIAKTSFLVHMARAPRI